MSDVRNIPVALCQYVIRERLYQPFTALMALHFNCPGIIQRKDAEVILAKLPKLSSRQSRKKVFSRLQSLDWIGIDPVSGKIYVRSLLRIGRHLGLCMKYAVGCKKDALKNFQAFIQAVVITDKLRQQHLAIKYQRRKQRPAVKYGETAQQEIVTFLGKNGLAALLNCSPSRALRIKHNLVKLGLLEAHNRLVRLFLLDKHYSSLRSHLNAIQLGSGDKLRFQKNDKGKLEVLEQLPDQLIPLLDCKKWQKGKKICGDK